MIKRILALCVAASLAACADAPAVPATPAGGKFDASDVGVYGVIHLDGHLTDIRYRLVQGTDRWKLEEQMSPGQWQDITCETACLLQDSSPADIERFTRGGLPAGISARCLHNHAFAFCRLSGVQDVERLYVLIALIRDPPVPIKLQRIE